MRVDNLFQILLIHFFLIVWSTRPVLEGKKIISYILFFDMKHIQSMLMIMQEYRSVCEGGADVSIVLFTTLRDENARRLKKHLLENAFCYRVSQHLNVTLATHSPSTSIFLSEEHRKHISSDLENFDIFIYQEDDILLQLPHIVSFLSETEKLRILGGPETLHHYNFGFQRFRRVISRKSPILGEFLEETPFFDPICLHGRPYFSVIGNPHQGMWILTREQLRALISKCKFNEQSIVTSREKNKRYVREYMSSLSLFANHIVDAPHCNITKLIAVEQIVSFFVQHVFPTQDPYFTKISQPLKTTIDHLRNGFAQLENPLLRVDFYNRPEKACWGDVFRTTRASSPHLNVTNEKIVFIRKEGDNVVYAFENGFKRKVADLNEIGSDKIHDINVGEIIDAIPNRN